jgi:hypothetical protein
MTATTSMTLSRVPDTAADARVGRGPDRRRTG